MKTKEFRKKLEESGAEELEILSKNSVEELFNLKFQQKTGQLEDPSKVRQLRKNIARIRTILSEQKNEMFWEKRGLKKPNRGKS